YEILERVVRRFFEQGADRKSAACVKQRVAVRGCLGHRFSRHDTARSIFHDDLLSERTCDALSDNTGLEVDATARWRRYDADGFVRVGLSLRQACPEHKREKRETRCNGSHPCHDVSSCSAANEARHGPTLIPASLMTLPIRAISALVAAVSSSGVLL